MRPEFVVSKGTQSFVFLLKRCLLMRFKEIAYLNRSPQSCRMRSIILLSVGLD